MHPEQRRRIGRFWLVVTRSWEKATIKPETPQDQTISADPCCAPNNAMYCLYTILIKHRSYMLLTLVRSMVSDAAAAVVLSTWRLPSVQTSTSRSCLLPLRWQSIVDFLLWSSILLQALQNNLPPLSCSISEYCFALSLALMYDGKCDLFAAIFIVANLVINVMLRLLHPRNLPFPISGSPKPNENVSQRGHYFHLGNMGDGRLRFIGYSRYKQQGKFYLSIVYSLPVKSIHGKSTRTDISGWNA